MSKMIVQYQSKLQITRELPDILSDKMLDKENLQEVFCLSNIQNIEVNESIQITRKNPKILSETESDRMEEDEDIVDNIKYVQYAFIFYPIMKPIQIDEILELRHFPQ